MAAYRISIPLGMEAKHAIEELSKATGASFGSTAGSFLDELAPSILRLAEAYREAKLDPGKAVKLVDSLAEESIQSLREEQHKLNLEVSK